MPPGKFDRDPPGFHRKGMPNAPRKDDGSDDPKALDRVAHDMHSDMERAIANYPEFGISQAEVDAKLKEYSDIGNRNGLKALENALEEHMKKDIVLIAENKHEIIDRLALSQAYLALTHDVSEDYQHIQREEQS